MEPDHHSHARMAGDNAGSPSSTDEEEIERESALVPTDSTPWGDAAASWLVIAIVVLAAILGTYAARGLFADGSYYLWRNASTQSFFIYGPSRSVAQFVTQIPQVTAMRFGVNDMAVLARLQSLGTVALPILVWALSLLVLRRHRAFWPFVALFALVFLNTGFLSVGEYNFAYAFVALNAAILVRGNFSKWFAVLLVLSAAMLVLSYETVALLGPLLLTLAIFRLTKSEQHWRDNRWRSTSLILSGAFYIMASTSSIFYIVFPRDANNMAAAGNFRFILEHDRQLALPIALCTLYVVVWAVGKKIVQQVATGLLLCLTTGLLVPSLWSPPWMEYSARALIALPFAGLLALVSVTSFRREQRAHRHSRTPGTSQVLFFVPFAVFLALMLPMTIYTIEFTQWTRSFQDVIVTEHGIKTNTTTAQTFKHDDLFDWTWTDPFLSVDLQTGPDQAMILSPGQIVSEDLVIGQNLPAPLSAQYRMEGPLFGG